MKKHQKHQPKQLFSILGVILGAILLVVGLIMINQVLSQPAPITQDEVFKLASGKTIGPEDAQVIVRVFSDFQCPYCRQFVLGSEVQLLRSYIQTGKSVRLEYKHFIVIDGLVGGVESHHAAFASECAAEQNAFWPYHNLLFANVRGEGTGSLRDQRLLEFGQTLGLNMKQFQSCFDTRSYLDVVEADNALALDLGVTSTPSVFVNNTRVANYADFNEISHLIEALLGS